MTERVEREVDAHGHVYRLVANRADPDDAWTARIVQYSLLGRAAPLLRPIVDPRGESHDQVAIMRTMGASGSTAEQALAVLEAIIRRAVDAATQVDTASEPDLKWWQGYAESATLDALFVPPPGVIGEVREVRIRRIGGGRSGRSYVLQVGYKPDDGEPT